MRPLLAPTTVAVVGASRRSGSIGRRILDSIVSGGFAGLVYPINPNASEIDGPALLCLGGRRATRHRSRHCRRSKGRPPPW